MNKTLAGGGKSGTFDFLIKKVRAYFLHVGKIEEEEKKKRSFDVYFVAVFIPILPRHAADLSKVLCVYDIDCWAEWRLLAMNERKTIGLVGCEKFRGVSALKGFVKKKGWE